ncbi:hypothetical protein B0H13DRAFT_1879022 [Mycena leptocephala]|nr:hypothetical protein B0H13DRAFT_1879022 [Mycena leptocephala]
MDFPFAHLNPTDFYATPRRSKPKPAGAPAVFTHPKRGICCTKLEKLRSKRLDKFISETTCGCLRSSRHVTENIMPSHPLPPGIREQDVVSLNLQNVPAAGVRQVVRPQDDDSSVRHPTLYRQLQVAQLKRHV